MALVTEVLLVSGVALDLVGAGVLSHAHNAESIVELREDIGEEGVAVGEPDALSTHAQLLAEKRIGFLFLTLGLVLYLSGIVLKSPEGLVMMGTVAGGVALAGLLISVGFTHVSRSLRSGVDDRILGRAGILAARADVTVDEFDHRHRRVVAVAEAGLHDAAIAALTGLVARAEDREELLDHILVAQLRHRLTAGMQVAALAERDDLLDDRTQVLRLGQRGDDLLVLDQSAPPYWRTLLCGARSCGSTADHEIRDAWLSPDFTVAGPRYDRLLFASGEE